MVRDKSVTDEIRAMTKADLITPRGARVLYDAGWRPLDDGDIYSEFDLTWDEVEKVRDLLEKVYWSEVYKIAEKVIECGHLHFYDGADEVDGTDEIASEINGWNENVDAPWDTDDMTYLEICELRDAIINDHTVDDRWRSKDLLIVVGDLCDKMYELRDAAGSFYDGGWRTSDRDLFRRMYTFSEPEIDVIFERFEEIQRSENSEED